jgi:hypothetical protein
MKKKYFKLLGLSLITLSCHVSLAKTNTNNEHRPEAFALRQVTESEFRRLINLDTVKSMLNTRARYIHSRDKLYQMPKLNYVDAIEQIEWAYRCGHLGDRHSRAPYTTKTDLLYRRGDSLRSVIYYPLFMVSYEHIDMYTPSPEQPFNRETPCQENKGFEIVTRAYSIKAKQCEMTRLQAYLDQYITEAEYLDMVRRGRAPVEVYSGAEVSCS